jgi:hypothetical protein
VTKGGNSVARKVNFGRRPKGRKKKGGSTAFHFGAYVSGNATSKKRRGGFGGGS